MATAEQLRAIRESLEAQRTYSEIMQEPTPAPPGQVQNRGELPSFLSGGPALAASATEMLKRVGNRLMPGQPFGQDNLVQMRQAFPAETSAAEIGLPLATAAIPGGLAVQTAIGAGQGALTADDATSGALTGAAGSVIGAGLGNLAGRIGNRLAGVRAAVTQTDEAGRLLSKLQDLGFDLSPGQITGDRVTRLAEATLKSQPFTGGAFSRMAIRNQKTLNRLAARAIGQNADNVGVLVRDQAADTLGKVFDKVGKEVGYVDIPQSTVDELSGMVPQRYLKNLGLERQGKLSGGLISGDEAMSLRSRLGKASRAAWRNGDDVTATVFDDMVDEIDGRMAVPDDLAEEWALAREQWRNLVAIEGGSALSAEGNVNARSLLTQQKRIFGQRPSGLLRQETQDLLDASRGIASQAFGDIVPDSGTATRQALMQAVGTAAEGAGGIASLGALPAAGEAFVQFGGAAADEAVTRAGAAAGRAAGGEFERYRKE
jgi:hypothetical protein